MTKKITQTTTLRYEDESEYLTMGQEIATSVLVLQSSFYGMQVFRTSPAPLTLLSEKSGVPATVSIGDKLKVVTSFETKWDFSLTIEKCWISDKPDAKPGQVTITKITNPNFQEKKDPTCHTLAHSKLIRY